MNNLRSNIMMGIATAGLMITMGGGSASAEQCSYYENSTNKGKDNYEMREKTPIIRSGRVTGYVCPAGFTSCEKPTGVGRCYKKITSSSGGGGSGSSEPANGPSNPRLLQCDYYRGLKPRWAVSLAPKDGCGLYTSCSNYDRFGASGCAMNLYAPITPALR